MITFYVTVKDGFVQLSTDVTIDYNFELIGDIYNFDEVYHRAIDVARLEGYL